MPYPSLGQLIPKLNLALPAASAGLRASLTAPSRGYEVGESSVSAESRAQQQAQFETAGAAIDAALREAAAQEEAAAAAAAAEAAKPFYVRKYGPLPFWAWAVGGTALLGVGVVVVRRRRK